MIDAIYAGVEPRDRNIEVRYQDGRKASMTARSPSISAEASS